MRAVRPTVLALVAAMTAAAVMTVVAGAGVAEAGKGRGKKKKPPRPTGQKVRIETEPVGATVYLGDKEAGAAGVTPLDLELPVGEQIVIIEMEGYLERFESIAIEELTGEAADSTQSFAYALDPAMASLMVTLSDGVLPEGTRVIIDGNDVGEIPVTIDVAVGAHQVELVAPGRAPYEEWIEVEGGQEHVMTVSGSSLGVPIDATPKRPRPPPGPIGVVRTGVELGGRRFRYNTPRTTNLRPYDARGNLHVVVDLELHPWRRFVDNRVLDRISLTAGVGWSPTITVDDTVVGNTIDAFWRSQHVGVRFRAASLPKLAVDIDAGWMHLLYTFRNQDNLMVDEVPDVDYHMVRIGARVVGKLAPVETWLGVENRLVLSGGELEDRFDSADIDGVAVRAGASMWFYDHHLEGRLEASLTRFGWTFQSETGDLYDAEGGSDLLYGVVLTVGGGY